MENHFSEVKKISDAFNNNNNAFNDTRIKAGYVLKSPNINVWSDW